MNQYTNARVKPIIGQPFANPNLKWEVRGYIKGTWFNVPFNSKQQAEEWLRQHI